MLKVEKEKVSETMNSKLKWLVAEEGFIQKCMFVCKEENLFHICKPFTCHDAIRLALCTCLKTATVKEKRAKIPELLHNAYISLIFRIYLKLHHVLIFVFAEFHTHQHKKSMCSIDMVNILQPGT